MFLNRKHLLFLGQGDENQTRKERDWRLFCKRMSSGLSRWIYEEVIEDDDEEFDQENMRQSQNIIVSTTPKQVVTKPLMSEAKQSLPSPSVATSPVPPKLPSETKPKRRFAQDPRMIYEKKLLEFQAKEKQAQLQICELQRKVASLEERVRVHRNEKKRVEQKQSESLAHKIANSVCKIVKDQELDVETREKVADAVGQAVARTLLQCSSKKVEAPSRAPPKVGNVKESQQLALI